MEFAGVESFSLGVAPLQASLGDARFLAGALPDAEQLNATPDEARWQSRSKLGILRSTLQNTLQIQARDPAGTVTIGLHSAAAGASGTVQVRLRLQSETPERTRVHWTAAITALTGLLKIAPSGMVRVTAQKVIDDTWAAVRAKLEQTDATQS